MIAAWLMTAPVLAQQYRMPAGDADYSSFYVTAYYDHGGNTDWNCGSDSYSGHNGSDYGVGSWSGMDAGMDIVAAADGVVNHIHDGEFDECTTADCAGGGGYGNHVRVDHGDGKETIYAHMKKWSVAVSVGQAVGCGQLLGQVGSSGYSTGPHLHFEVRTSGNDRVDPYQGSCSSTSSTYWVSQGSYGGLPAGTCDEPVGPCEPVRTLTCGDSVSGRNDGSGHTSDHWFYGCEEWTYSGSEIAYEILTDRSEPVTVSVTGLSADLDLYLLSSTSCDGSGCLASSSESESSDESATANATAEVPLVAVIDGFEGAASGFTLTVSCDGGLPGQDTDTDTRGPTDTAPDTTPPDSGPSVADTAPDTRPSDPSADGWDRIEKPQGGGLGCGIASGAGSAWLVGLLALARRREE